VVVLLVILVVGGVFREKTKDVAVTQAPTREPVKVRPTEAKEVLLPLAPVLAPQGSEWAGAGLLTSNQGARMVGGAWTFTERRGSAFKALTRGGFGWKILYEGTIDADRRLILDHREVLEPEAKPREEIKGVGEIGMRRMTVVVEEVDNSSTARVDYKLLPNGGEGFTLEGRWRCSHRPNGWNGGRTVREGTVITDRHPTHATWGRDGGLVLVNFDGGGREWLIIDPDKPNELSGSNGTQNVTWVRP